MSDYIEIKIPFYYSKHYMGSCERPSIIFLFILFLIIVFNEFITMHAAIFVTIAVVCTLVLFFYLIFPQKNIFLVDDEGNLTIIKTTKHYKQIKSEFKKDDILKIDLKKDSDTINTIYINTSEECHMVAKEYNIIEFIKLRAFLYSHYQDKTTCKIANKDVLNYLQNGSFPITAKMPTPIRYLILAGIIIGILALILLVAFVIMLIVFVVENPDAITLLLNNH